MTPLILLVSGIPRAGKSSFADVVEQSSLGFSHVPIDKYIMPIPSEESFLNWVREPSCIDWDLLLEHLHILFSGQVCFTPKVDWSQSGQRVSDGGAIEEGPGRKMTPSKYGYVIAGTHAYSLPDIERKRIKAYIDVSDEVIASRLEGRPISFKEAGEIILKHLGDNPEALRPLRSQADLIIDGDMTHGEQLEKFKTYLAEIKK